MGSINTRNGRLLFDFRYLGIRCREQTKLVDSSANRKRAKQILEHIEAEITLGTFEYATYFPKSKKVEKLKEHNLKINQTNAEVPTFEAFSKTWYGECEVTWKTSHKRSVKGTLDKYLVPEFGSLPVNQITKAAILAFRAKISKLPGRTGNKTWSAEHVNHTMTPLRQILNEAADRYGFTTPYRGIKALKVPKTEVEPFTIDQVRKIISTVRPDFKNYYTVRFYTGMRSSEIHGLQWQYIDFERRQIMIRKTIVRGEITTTKNDGSLREIEMSQPIYSALKEQKNNTGNKIFVFCSKEGMPLDNNNVTKRVWYPLLKHLELKKRRPYQSRHTTATLWLAAGENPEWIARQMGHTTTEMLFRVYSRFVPNLTRRDGSAFERLLNSEMNNTGNGKGYQK